MTGETGFPASIDLASLTTDRQLRDVDAEHVRTLGEVLDRCPPILVGMPGAVLLDGYMRVAAAEEAGLVSLPAHYVSGTPVELLEAQVRANAAHGLPLTRKERGQIVDRLIAGAPDWSNYRIAAAAGVHEKTVRNHRDVIGNVARDLDAEIPKKSAESPQPRSPGRVRRILGRLLGWLRRRLE